MDDLWRLVTGELQPWQWVAILTAAFASGVFHTVSGFAGGLVLSILIAPVIGVEEVVPVLAVTLMISGATRLWTFRKDLDLATYASVMIPALPGIVFGAVVYSHLAPSTIAIVLGLFLLVTVASRRPLERRGRKVGAVGLGIVGSLFGVLSGMTIGAGMMLAPFLMGRGLFKERLAAVFAGIGFVLNVTKSSVFLATATLDAHLVLLGVALGLFSVPGNYLGYAIIRRTPIKVHTGFVELLILTSGVAFLLTGIFD
jgi:uncharacterized membrane protein YfcA